MQQEKSTERVARWRRENREHYLAQKREHNRRYRERIKTLRAVIEQEAIKQQEQT